MHTITEYDARLVKAMAGKAKPAGLVWDYLWGNYSCLGDKEYEEFEGNSKYACKLNELTAKEGMANLHTQLRRPAAPGHPGQGLQAGHLLHGLLPADPGQPQPPRRPSTRATPTTA